MHTCVLEAPLERRVFEHLNAVCAQRFEGWPQEQPGRPAASIFTGGWTAIDVEELLGYMDGARVLLFSDVSTLPACREYVAAYLASARRDENPCLVLQAFGEEALACALRRWELLGCDEDAFAALLSELERHHGGVLPGGYADLLRIALSQGIEVRGVKPTEEELERAPAVIAARLRLLARRQPVIALIGAETMEPETIAEHYLAEDGLETVAVYQSPPELFWHLRSQLAPDEIPDIVHLCGTWAFATIATHPIFYPAAELATLEEDVLLPPPPAHTRRRADTPMIEMLYGAAELLRPIIGPELRSPESVRVATFLDADLPARLETLRVPVEVREQIISSAATATSLALPELNLAYIGQPRLSLAIEALFGVLFEQPASQQATARSRDAIFSRRACAAALAFFASGLVAGRRAWPSLEPLDDPEIILARTTLDRLEKALEKAPGQGRESPRMRLLPGRTEQGIELRAARSLGRFLGALLLAAIECEQVAIETVAELSSSPWQRKPAVSRLLRLTALALS